MTVAILGKLKDNERKSVLGRMGMPPAELRAVQDVEEEASKNVKLLSGPKTAAPRDTYAFLEKAPLESLAYILAESSNAKAVGKIKTLFHKWKPLRQALPGVAIGTRTVWAWSAVRNSIKFWKISSSCSFWAARASRKTMPRFCVNFPA